MMNFRDKKSKRTLALVICVFICVAMVVGLLTGIMGVAGMM